METINTTSPNGGQSLPINHGNGTQDAVNTASPAAVEQGVWVPLRDIVVPEDSRPHREEDIESRALSMEREGQLENALLSREDGKLILVFGKGRYLSAQKRNWECLRCDIREGMTPSQKLMAQLAENEEREDASPFYTAKLYQRIMAAEQLSAEKLPEYLGKSRATVYNYLALAKLPAEIQAMSNRLDIAMTHWLEIIKLPKPEEQIQLAQECADQDYSVRELQARVKKLLKPAQDGAKAPARPDLPACRIKVSWKDGRLVVKADFDPELRSYSNFGAEAEQACQAFVQQHPRSVDPAKAEDVPAAV